MHRCNSMIAILTMFVWAILIVCSDDVLVYAAHDYQECVSLSSVIREGSDLWAETNTDFVLKDLNSLRLRLRSNNCQSRIRTIQSGILIEPCLLQFIQWKRYIWPLEIDPYVNEKIIMNYLHRQDGDK